MLQKGYVCVLFRVHRGSSMGPTFIHFSWRTISEGSGSLFFKQDMQWTYENVMPQKEYSIWTFYANVCLRGENVTAICDINASYGHANANFYEYNTWFQSLRFNNLLSTFYSNIFILTRFMLIPESSEDGSRLQYSLCGSYSILSCLILDYFLQDTLDWYLGIFFYPWNLSNASISCIIIIILKRQ